MSYPDRNPPTKKPKQTAELLGIDPDEYVTVAPGFNGDERAFHDPLGASHLPKCGAKNGVKHDRRSTADALNDGVAPCGQCFPDARAVFMLSPATPDAPALREDGEA